MSAVAALEHPHILSINDFGEQDGSVFLVRPYVSGSTLRERLGKPLPLADVIRLLRPIADALDYAHRQGIVHGDVKPGNVLLHTATHPLLADLGTAQVLVGGNTVGTAARGAHFGTPEYLSPEQGLGEIPDGRADLYALGVILYEALTGRPPFRRENSTDTAFTIAMHQLSTPPPAPRDLNPALSPSVERVLLRALAKDPAGRYPSGAALFAALEEARSEGARSGGAPANSALNGGGATATRWRRPGASRGARLGLVLLVSLLLGAGILGLLAIAGGRGEELPTAEAAATAPQWEAVTPPQAGTTWFFADSWTGAGYRTIITLSNPGAEDANVAITFLGTDGVVTARAFPVFAGAENKIDLRDLLGRDVIRAHRITANQPIFVTHLITNGRGGTAIPGAPAEATAWRFSEQYSTAEADKWLELANFRNVDATIRVTNTPGQGRGEAVHRPGEQPTAGGGEQGVSEP